MNTQMMQDPQRDHSPAAAGDHRTHVHPTAIVHPSAELGEGVCVGPYCVIGPAVTVGDRTRLHNHVTIQGHATIGHDNEVFPYAVLGAEPQDLKYRGRDTALIIGDRNKIREHATIHRGTELGGTMTVIGDDCLIMVGVHVAHDCTIESEVVIANNTMLGGHCLVEFGATIAGGVGVHHFATISKLSFVGGLARVVKDVPPYTVVEGHPAEARKLNTTALVRRRWAEPEIERLRQAFKLIYRTPDMTVREAPEVLRADPEQIGPVLELCRFVERCEAGVHGRYLESRRADSPDDRTR